MIMKKQIIRLTLGLALLGAAATAAAQSTINIYLSDAGSGQTAFSWSVTGDLVSPGGQTLSGGVGGFLATAGIFTGFINNIGANTSYIPVTGFGSFVDLTSSASEQYKGIQFDVYAPDSLFVWLGNYVSPSQPYTMLSVSGGDHMQYDNLVDSAIIDVPYSCFNPGTYQYISPGAAEAGADGGPFTTDLTMNLTVGPVPEPSTLALAGLGGLGLLLFRRRK
jgi:hypothetical protein